jgi:hypothetical protein
MQMVKRHDVAVFMTQQWPPSGIACIERQSGGQALPEAIAFADAFEAPF